MEPVALMGSLHIARAKKLFLNIYKYYLIMNMGARKRVSGIYDSFRFLLFNPFIPMKLIVSGFQSLYGVLLGITYTNAFTLFAENKYFDFNRTSIFLIG